RALDPHLPRGAEALPGAGADALWRHAEGAGRGVVADDGRRRAGAAGDGRLPREGRAGRDRHAGRAAPPGAQALLGFPLCRVERRRQRRPGRRRGAARSGGPQGGRGEEGASEEEVKAAVKARGAKRVPRVGFVSLGCPKALVDSEQILTQLRAEGYDIAPSYDGADLVVVNTCGFIDAAVAESLDAIGEALAENGKVIVTGCLGAKDGGPL